jgi:hypothetical protein
VNAAESLTIGTQYAVRMQDCCVEGEFTATVTEKVYDEKEPDFLAEVAFDNGVRLFEDMAVTFTEVQS